MTKSDRILDLGLRLLVFVYSATMLCLSVWQLERDRQFVIVVGTFALVCTSIYLFDAIYTMITGRSFEHLRSFIHGSRESSAELPDLKRVCKIIAFMAGLLVMMYLFGMFLVLFLAMAGFPMLYDRRSLLISTIVAMITTGSFYYLFVHMMGISLYRGLLFGF